MTIPYIVIRPQGSDNSFISIKDDISSVVGVIVEEADYAIKETLYKLGVRARIQNVIF
jgi:hypothetical protein